MCARKESRNDRRGSSYYCVGLNIRTETYERFDRIGGTHQTSETYLTPSLVATRRQGL